MAATLFIIKIPTEKEEVALDQLGIDSEIDIDDKEKCIEQTDNSIFYDSDLEVDAQRVVVKTDSLDSLRKVSSLKNIENIDELNTNTKENEITASENVVVGYDEYQLKPTGSTQSMTLVTSSSENINKDENETRLKSSEEINSPSGETPEPTHHEDEVPMVDFIPKEPLETQLKNLFESMSITNVTWSNAGLFKQAWFTDCGDPDRLENILEKVMSIGIGQKILGSSISLFPATVHIENINANKDDESLLNLENENEKEKESEFRKSVKSRMIVAQVVETVRSNAVFTFDYCMLIILASMIAVIGLIENSSVILVASMLISPLMGPILAGTFGITIQNGPLRNLGIRSECIGLTMCIICGFICGLIVGVIQLQGLTGYVDEWPTMEMKSRGMSRSLWVGVFIALPSGAGVSLSVLGGNIGSLVGVAISASLLPPAVNAGMLWSFALLTTITPLETVPLNSTFIPIKHLGCLPYVDNEYEPVYSCNMSKEMGIMGAISLLLTIVNIFCIFLVGVFMLKIKEVVPQIAPENTHEFWGSDLKVARDSYKTMKGTESAYLRKQFQDEWEKLSIANERKESAKKRRYNFEMFFKKMSTSLPNNTYWTTPYNPQLAEEDKTPHTIHDISKIFDYETTTPSPGIRIARPFSFPNYTEEIPPKKRKSKKHKKIRFHLPVEGKKKKKFTVTSVPESLEMLS